MSEGPLWDVIDCFSGGGLFSLGGQAAGMQIRECVDNSPDALSVYKLNFPVNVSCATLGPGLSEYAFPKPRPQLHVHLSPPCTELSNAKSGKRLEAEGIAMLRWSVEIGGQYHSFSVETVYTAHTLALAKEMVVEQPEVIKFGVYDAINFSAPQSRVRLIISTPQIIKRLNEAPASARVSVEDAFNAARRTPARGYSSQEQLTRRRRQQRSTNTRTGLHVLRQQGLAFLRFSRADGRIHEAISHTRVDGTPLVQAVWEAANRPTCARQWNRVRSFSCHCSRRDGAANRAVVGTAHIVVRTNWRSLRLPTIGEAGPASGALPRQVEEKAAE